jgi:hypothetical protein
MRRVVVSLFVFLVFAASCAGERPTFDDSAAREVDLVDVVETTTTVAADRPVVRLAVADGWSLDPADAGPASLANRVVADLLYEGLTSLDDLGLPQAAHAERWFTSEDRLTWTFLLSGTLVDGAGETFSARDAKSSLERIAARGASDQAASALMSISGWADYMSGTTGGVGGISAPDETTLVIQLDTANELLLNVLASPAFGLTGTTVDGSLRTTGAFRPTSDPVRFEAVSPDSPIAGIDLVNHVDGPAAALAAGSVDWAVLGIDDDSTGLDADIVRQPLDLQVALVARQPDEKDRLGTLGAVESLTLANSVPGLTARFVPAVPGDYPSPTLITVDVPVGSLLPLGEALVAQLEAAGASVDKVFAEPEDFAARIASGEAEVFPVIIAGGTGPASGVLRLAVPGAIDDVFGPQSRARAELAEAVFTEFDIEQRALFAEALERALIEDGLLLPIGRYEVRVALGHRLDGLRHRSDGTLDLRNVEIADS